MIDGVDQQRKATFLPLPSRNSLTSKLSPFAAFLPLRRQLRWCPLALPPSLQFRAICAAKTVSSYSSSRVDSTHLPSRLPSLFNGQFVVVAGCGILSPFSLPFLQSSSTFYYSFNDAVAFKGDRSSAVGRSRLSRLAIHQNQPNKILCPIKINRVIKSQENQKFLCAGALAFAALQFFWRDYYLFKFYWLSKIPLRRRPLAHPSSLNCQNPQKSPKYSLLFCRPMATMVVDQQIMHIRHNPADVSRWSLTNIRRRHHLQ